MEKEMNKILFCLIINFYLISCFAETILFNPHWILHRFAREEKSYGEEMFIKKLKITGVEPLSGHEFYMNINELIDLCNLFNSYCVNTDILHILNFYYNEEELKNFLHNMDTNNSYYIQRLNYYKIGISSNEKKLETTLDKINKAGAFERAILIQHLSELYWNGSKEDKEKIFNFVCTRWENTPYYGDTYPLINVYNSIKSDFDRSNDNRKNKFGESFIIPKRVNLKKPSFYQILKGFCIKPCLPTRIIYKPNKRFDFYYTYSQKYDGEITDKSNPWHINAYKELVALGHALDADFVLFFFRNIHNEELIDLARKHIQNPDFKDARYKTVYYLVNHDFDYSFPILTNMVNNNSLHINEKKNFYRGLARLNKVSHSVLTKEQQQKANDYLKQQMHSEKDIATQLYIDFLLSICVDEYGLSDDRTAFLNSLKEIDTVSQEDIAQIDRRLKIIKYSIYMHSPSIFDSYVNGLKTEKPFIDVSKVDIYSLPIYEAKANGETWYYHDVNSEAYIAESTNNFSSANIIVPLSIDNYSVVGIAPFAFSDNRKKVNTVILQNSIKTIEKASFTYNTNLLSVAIPNSVTNIGPNIFYQSPNLQYLYLEEGCTFTDEWFYDVYHGGGCLTPNCKIIRTKFENGLPVIPPEGESEAESP